MKSPEQLVADRLKDSAIVAALLGDRVYPVMAPASAALPFVTWRRAGVQREMTLHGPAAGATVTLSVDMYDTTYSAVRELADRCREVLNGFGGALGNWVLVRNVTLLNEFDGFVQLAGGEMPPVYSVTQTYTVLWQEI